MDPFLVDQFASFPDSSQAASLSQAAASASTSPSSNTAISGALTSSSSAVPRDVLDLTALLQSMSLSYHPSILPLLLDHYHHYTASLLTYLHSVSSYAGRPTVDEEVIDGLITAFTASTSPAPPPPSLELMLPLAVQRNAIPLPPSRIVKEKGEVFLPPERYLLTRPNYQLDTTNQSTTREGNRGMGGTGGGGGANNGEGHSREAER
jgi:hypothetical protein